MTQKKSSTNTDLEMLNETGKRKKTDRRSAIQPVAVDRRKTSRRRQIDPTTCERDYNTDEIEFMQAMDEYKQSSGRMFPTCSEILEVLKGLGYQKTSRAVACPIPVATDITSISMPLTGSAD